MTLRKILPVLLCAAAALASDLPPAAAAGAKAARGVEQALSEGTVKKVDTAAGHVTLAHGPIANLDMPAMTMAFKVANPALLKGVKVGDAVRFRAEQRADQLVITQLRR